MIVKAPPKDVEVAVRRQRRCWVSCLCNPSMPSLPQTKRLVAKVVSSKKKVAGRDELLRSMFSAVIFGSGKFMNLFPF